MTSSNEGNIDRKDSMWKMTLPAWIDTRKYVHLLCSPDVIRRLRSTISKYGNPGRSGGLMASAAALHCCRHISVVGKGLFSTEPVIMRENVPQIIGADRPSHPSDSPIGGI